MSSPAEEGPAKEPNSGKNPVAISPNPPHHDVVEACMQRLEQWRARQRKKPYWGLYQKHSSSLVSANGEIIVCVLCHDIDEPVPTLKDNKMRSGYFF